MEEAIKAIEKMIIESGTDIEMINRRIIKGDVPFAVYSERTKLQELISQLEQAIQILKKVK